MPFIHTQHLNQPLVHTYINTSCKLHRTTHKFKSHYFLFALRVFVGDTKRKVRWSHRNFFSTSMLSFPYLGYLMSATTASLSKCIKCIFFCYVVRKIFDAVYDFPCLFVLKIWRNNRLRFCEPCFVIYICKKNQQNAHYFSIMI